MHQADCEFCPTVRLKQSARQLTSGEATSVPRAALRFEVANAIGRNGLLKQYRTEKMKQLVVACQFFKTSRPTSNERLIFDRC